LREKESGTGSIEGRTLVKWIAGRVRCLGGRHERSEKHIRASTDEKHVSRCRYCGTPMKRRAKRDWIVISRAEYRELAR
jgi:ribosomal protein S14